MAAPLLPILAGVLRGLVGRAAMSAVGQGALRMGARAIGSFAARRGATAAAAEAGSAARGAAAAKQAVTAATPAPAPGFVRFFHGGQPYDGNHGRWVTPILDYAKGYAEKSKGAVVSYVDFPEGHPDLKKSFDDTGTSQKAPYVNFRTSEEDARRLQPYREAQAQAPAPRTGASFADIVKGYGRQAQHHAGQFFSNVRRGWEGQPLQWQRYTPPSTPPGSSPPASTPAPGGSAGGGFQNLVGNYMKQASQWAAGKMERTNIGQMYSAFNELRSYKAPPTNPNAPPQFQPNVVANYPNLSEEKLAQLSGKSAEEFAAADKAAGIEQKRVEEEQRAIESSKKLGSAFRGLAGVVFGAGPAIVSVAAGATRLVGRQVDSDASEFGRVNAAYGSIRARREFQEISLNQRVAAATSGSAKMLNQVQMTGREELAKISADLKTITNTGLTAVQAIATGILMIANTAMEFSGARAIVRWAEQALGAEDPESTMETALKEAIRANKGVADKKRNAPIKKVF